MARKIYQPQQALPHHAPMLLIDDILDWDEDHIETSAGKITNGLFTLDDGSRSSLICMEYLCQSAAAHAGIRQLEQGKAVTIGFIIGARKIEIHETAYRSGDQFRIKVEQTFRDESGIGVYDCTLYHANTERYGNEPVAIALIKAMMPDNPHEIIHR